MLCVLIGHALIVFALMNLTRPNLRTRPEPAEVLASLLFFIEEDQDEQSASLPEPSLTTPRVPDLPADSAIAEASLAASESEGVTERGFIDWPVETKKSAARVLAAEREAERIAKMFAGPDGTWASLTKRQRDELDHFRWAPGVDGLERDENGNTIYQLKNGCALVNFMFFGCPIGKKPPPYGDLFKDMRLHFDEQRRPPTNEGNGLEPESKRPPRWSKPLPEKPLRSD